MLRFVVGMRQIDPAYADYWLPDVLDRASSVSGVCTATTPINTSMIPADYDFTIYRSDSCNLRLQWQADKTQPADLECVVTKSHHEDTCPYYRPHCRG